MGLLPRRTIIALHSLQRRSHVYGMANWRQKAVSKSRPHVSQLTPPPDSQKRSNHDPKWRWPNSTTFLVEFGQLSYRTLWRQVAALGNARTLSSQRAAQPSHGALGAGERQVYPSRQKVRQVKGFASFSRGLRGTSNGPLCLSGPFSVKSPARLQFSGRSAPAMDFTPEKSG